MVAALKSQYVLSDLTLSESSSLSVLYHYKHRQPFLISALMSPAIT